MTEVGNLGGESVGSMENSQVCYLGYEHMSPYLHTYMAFYSRIVSNEVCTLIDFDCCGKMTTHDLLQMDLFPPM